MKSIYSHGHKGILACALAGAIVVVPDAESSVVTVAASHVGGFFDDGSYSNFVEFQNYYVGYSTLTSRAERRSFFVFELPLFVPSGEELVGIEFALQLPKGGLIFGMQLDDGMPPMPYSDTAEEFEIALSPFPAHLVMTPLLDSSAADAIFGSLGTGNLGSKVISSSDALGFVPPPPGFYSLDIAEIVVPFTPAGIALFTSSVSGGATLVIGGAMASWTSNDELVPGGSALVEKTELMFGLSDFHAFVPPLGDFTYTGLPAPELRFVFAPTPVPLPPALTLFACGIAAVARWQRKRTVG